MRSQHLPPSQLCRQRVEMQLQRGTWSRANKRIPWLQCGDRRRSWMTIMVTNTFDRSLDQPLAVILCQHDRPV